MNNAPPRPGGRDGRARGDRHAYAVIFLNFSPPLKKFFNGLLDDLPQHPCTSVLEKSVVVFPVLEDVQMDSQVCNPLTSAFCVSHKLLDIRRTNYDDYYMFGLRLLTDTVHVEQQSAVIIIMPHTPLSRRSSSALPISFLGVTQYIVSGTTTDMFSLPFLRLPYI